MLTSTHNQYLIAAAYCENHAGDVLLVQQTNRRGTYWGVPGGKCDAGESFRQAVIREFAEETGIETATAGELLCVSEAWSHKTQFVVMTFNVLAPPDAVPHADNDPDGHITRAAFVPRAEARRMIETTKLTHMRTPMLDIIDGNVKSYYVFDTPPGIDDFSQAKEEHSV